MKKIALFFTALLLSMNFTYAYEALYTIQNVKKESVKPYIESAFDSNYIVNKKDPYYLTSSKNNEDNITVILQKSGADVLYY